MLEYQRFLFFPQKRTMKPEYERTYEQLKAGFGWKYYKFLWDRRDRVQMELESHIYSERCSCLYTNPDSESNTPIPPATDHPSSCLLQPRPPQGTYLHNPSLSAKDLTDQIPNTVWAYLMIYETNLTNPLYASSDILRLNNAYLLSDP